MANLRNSSAACMNSYFIVIKTKDYCRFPKFKRAHPDSLSESRVPLFILERVKSGPFFVNVCIKLVLSKIMGGVVPCHFNKLYNSKDCFVSIGKSGATP